MFKLITFLIILLACNNDLLAQFIANETYKKSNAQLFKPTVTNEYNYILKTNNSLIVNKDLSKQLSFDSEKKRRGGFGRGAWIGATSGFILGGLVELVSYTPCEGFCLLAPDSAGTSAIVGAIVGTFSGAFIGGVTGLIIKLTKNQ